MTHHYTPFEQFWTTINKELATRRLSELRYGPVRRLWDQTVSCAIRGGLIEDERHYLLNSKSDCGQ